MENTGAPCHAGPPSTLNSTVAELSDLTAQCIRCGFCLESCPTFVITGDESQSPRGRIYLARSWDEGVLPLSPEARAAIDTCVGCRACETACPSAVKYGEILELVRESFELDGHNKPLLNQLLDTLSNPGRLRFLLSLSRLFAIRKPPRWVGRLFSDQDTVFEIPVPGREKTWEPLNEADLPPIRGTVSLLEGCLMGVAYADVHTATERLLRRIGFQTERVKGCCGALHAHNGKLKDGRRMAGALNPRHTLVTNSAGCGSWLKETIAGATVFDASEFLFENGLTDVLRASSGLPGLVATYHDACHLAHGQGVRSQPRDLLRAIPGLNLVPLAESDVCCGSGGVYNLLQPGMAKKMLDRKWRNVVQSAATVVATGNPGCHAWIEQAARENGGQTTVVHTLSLFEASFSGNLD